MGWLRCLKPSQNTNDIFFFGKRGRVCLWASGLRDAEIGPPYQACGVKTQPSSDCSLSLQPRAEGLELRAEIGSARNSRQRAEDENERAGPV